MITLFELAYLRFFLLNSGYFGILMLKHNMAQL